MMSKLSSLRVALLVCVVVLAFTGAVRAEQSVIVSSVNGYFYDAVAGASTGGDCLVLSAAVEFHIHTTNTDFADC